MGPCYTKQIDGNFIKGNKIPLSTTMDRNEK